MRGRCLSGNCSKPTYSVFLWSEFGGCPPLPRTPVLSSMWILLYISWARSQQVSIVQTPAPSDRLPRVSALNKLKSLIGAVFKVKDKKKCIKLYVACLKEVTINPYTGSCFLGCQIWFYETGVLIRTAQGYSTVFTVPVTLTVIQGQRIYLHVVFLCFVLFILPTRKTVAFISVYVTRKSHYTETKTSLLHYPGRLRCAPVSVGKVCRPHVCPLTNWALKKNNFGGYRYSAAFNSHYTVQFHPLLLVWTLQNKWRSKEGLSYETHRSGYLYFLVVGEEYKIALVLTENFSLESHFERDLLYTDKSTTVYVWILNID